MFKLILSSIFIITILTACSSKKEQTINYKMQQENAKEALKGL